MFVKIVKTVTLPTNDNVNVMKRLFMVLLLLAVAGHSVEAKKPARQDSKVKNIIYMIGDGMGLCHVSLLQIEADTSPRHSTVPKIRPS